MESVSLDMINKQLASLVSAVNDIKIHIGLSVDDFDGFESQKDLDAWNQAGERAFRNFAEQHE
jgi:hypothetical protein